MEEANNLFQKAIYFAIGGSVVAAEKTSKFIADLPDQVEDLTSEMLNRGEAIYQEWYQEAGQREAAVSPTLRSKLFSLAGGNGNLVERLLAQARQKYPGNSETWYYEKVIYDLERDR